MASYSTDNLIGAVNNAQTTVVEERALHFEEWSGEVLANFTNKTPASQHHMKKTVSSGKRHTFSEVGDVTAAGHQMGTELTGQQVDHGARYVDIEDLQIIADVFTPNADQMLAIYDESSHLAMKTGDALAQRSERDVFRNMYRAGAEDVVAGITTPPNALIDDPLKQGNGTTLSATLASGLLTATDDLFPAISAIAEAFDTKNVPDEGRYTWVPPSVWYLLIGSGNNMINSDYNGNTPNGHLGRAAIDRVANTIIVKTNNIATVKVASQATVDTDVQSDYDNDMSKCLFMVSTKEAVGSVYLRGITTESWYDPRAQGDMILAKMFKGVGVLRPECAGVILEP